MVGLANVAETVGASNCSRSKPLIKAQAVRPRRFAAEHLLRMRLGILPGLVAERGVCGTLDLVPPCTRPRACNAEAGK